MSPVSFQVLTSNDNVDSILTSGPTTKPRPGFEPGPMQHILTSGYEIQIQMPWSVAPYLSPIS